MSTLLLKCLGGPLDGIPLDLDLESLQSDVVVQVLTEDSERVAGLYILEETDDHKVIRWQEKGTESCQSHQDR